ncbi:MAG TPA: hypothetical protein VNN08_20965 [Thermoanaerobaculia bacterium]|nr:hypothetical protein [Thermoanaerobaculia bacterium]
MADPKRKRMPLDDYIDVQPALHMVRIMRRFFEEIVDEPPFRAHLPELHVAYMEILNEELASYALNLALAITELEDAYPEIGSGRD